MNLLDTGQVEVVAGDVDVEGSGRRIVSRASSDDGIVVDEMQLVENDFAVGDMEGGIELLNGLTVGGSVAEMNLSLAVRIGEGAGGLNRNIGFAEDRIVVSRESLNVSDIGVVEVGAQGESTVASEMAVLERGEGIEFGGGVVMAQLGIVQSDRAAGNL